MRADDCKMLTHDAGQAQRYIDDPLITKNIAVNVLIDLYDASTRLNDDTGAIRTPTLVIVGGADWVVRREEQERFFRRGRWGCWWQREARVNGDRVTGMMKAPPSSHARRLLR
jgi:alpha-beta hydrolase superfamily lysophospholipase